MGRTQCIAAVATALLVLLTYWGCPVRAPKAGMELKSAPVAATGLETLIRAARDELSATEIATLANLEERLELAENSDTEAIRPLLENLAGEWFGAGQPAISGVYARRIAEESEQATDWNIAATTFSLCLQREDTDDKTRQFCADQAEEAYQSAISLDPDNVDARINLAVSYTDYPPKDNPMKGIQMLVQLEKDNPGNARANITLAQLAIRTNQLDRAAVRFEKAVVAEPDNPDAVCPLAQVYEKLGQNDKAMPYIERCKELLNQEKPLAPNGESR